MTAVFRLDRTQAMGVHPARAVSAPPVPATAVSASAAAAAAAGACSNSLLPSFAREVRIDVVRSSCECSSN
jgi:hypothetical protein